MLAIVSIVKDVEIVKNDGYVAGARYGSGLRVSAGSWRSCSLGMILGNREVDVTFLFWTRYCPSSPFYPFFIPRPWLRSRVFNFSPLSSLKRRKHPLGVKTKSFPPTSPASRWLFNPSSVSLLSKGQYFPCHLVSGAMVNDTRRVTSTFVPEDRFYVDRRSGLNETFRRFIAAWPRIETRIPRAIEK